MADPDFSMSDEEEEESGYDEDGESEEFEGEAGSTEEDESAVSKPFARFGSRSLSPRTPLSHHGSVHTPTTPYNLYSSEKSYAADAFAMGEGAESSGSKRSSLRSSRRRSTADEEFGKSDRVGRISSIRRESTLSHDSLKSEKRRTKRVSILSSTMPAEEGFVGESTQDLDTTAEIDLTAEADILREESLEVDDDQESNSYWSELPCERMPRNSSEELAESESSKGQETEDKLPSYVEVARRGPLQKRLTVMLQIAHEAPVFKPSGWRDVLESSKKVISSEGSNTVVSSEGVARKAKTVVRHRSLRSSSSLNLCSGEQPVCGQETAGGSTSSRQSDPDKKYEGLNNVWLAPEDFAFLDAQPPVSNIKTSTVSAAMVSQDVLDWHIWNLSQEHEHVLLDSHELEAVQDMRKHKQLQDYSCELLQIGHGCQGLVQAESEALAAYSAEAHDRLQQFRSLVHESQMLDGVLQKMQDAPIDPRKSLELENCLQTDIASKELEIVRLERHLASVRRFSSNESSGIAKRASPISDVSDTLTTNSRFLFTSHSSLEPRQFTGPNVAMATCSSSDTSDNASSAAEPKSELLQLREEIRARAIALRMRRDNCGSRDLSLAAPSPPIVAA
mmetsp:Transcript_24180/g.38623  ORF Transcript_24180/g.38623 Transcript_24180/m.38623 type:complete len:619 (-) Transcript_24180:3-1859(-)